MSATSSEVTIIGAGFGGLTMAHRLAEIGIDDVVVLERSDGVGGTWRANRYPGAACDVPSHLYSLSFAPNPNWSKTYADQPEILDYVERCYDELDVRRKVRCGVEVTAATWDDERRHWRLRDRDGATHETSILVSAIGLFHTPTLPAIAGLDDFAGPVVHSARWGDGSDVAGRRVAVIGTGASAIQIVPAIVDDVAELTLYQRTPAWILPRKDEPYTDEQRRTFAERPETACELRQQLHDLFEQNRAFVRGDPWAATIDGMARGYLEHKVADPTLRAALTPDYAIGCKRVLVSSDFYPAVQRDHVELVTTPIEQIVPEGIRTVDGTVRPCDTIVCCTGFRATEYLCGIDVTGRDGTGLQDHWDGVPSAYHGIAVPGFPNLFLMYGPNTNQGGNSILLVLEAQADFVADAVTSLRSRGAAAIEVRPEAMDRYRTDLRTALGNTVWDGGCDSYFRTAAGDIVTQLPHTAGWYREQTARIDPVDFTFIA